MQIICEIPDPWRYEQSDAEAARRRREDSDARMKALEERRRHTDNRGAS
jgi:hypothetical protein